MYQLACTSNHTLWLYMDVSLSSAVQNYLQDPLLHLCNCLCLAWGRHCFTLGNIAAVVIALLKLVLPNFPEMLLTSVFLSLECKKEDSWSCFLSNMGTSSVLGTVQASRVCLLELSALLRASPMGLHGSLVVDKIFSLV